MIDESALEGVAGAAVEGAAADAAAPKVYPSVRRRARRVRPGDACRNCGVALVDAYCGHCGQLADDFHRPFWSLFAEALEDIFSFEGRFIRTVPRLLLRPGQVSHLYVRGARARFVAPFRLFIFASIVFFLAFSIRSGDASEWFEIDGAIDEAQVVEASADIDRVLEELRSDGAAPPGVVEGLEAARERLEITESEIAQGDEAAAELRRETERRAGQCVVRAGLVPEEPVSPECRAAVAATDAEFNMSFGGLEELPHPQRVWLAERIGAAIERPEDWIAAMQRWAPRVVFALVPLYAFMLALLHFWRRNVFLYDHVVVSLHFHAFLFIFTVLLLVVELVVPLPIVVLGFLVWSNYALYRTHRLVYADSRIGSALRVIVLDFAYLIVLSFALLALMVLGVAFV